MENQTERFEERIDDYRKIWKLSPMDLESHRRWYDFSRARDAMFAATDTAESPWYVVDANDQRRGAPELHRPPPEPDPLRRGAAREGEAAQAPAARGLRRAGLPVPPRPGEVLMARRCDAPWRRSTPDDTDDDRNGTPLSRRTRGRAAAEVDPAQGAERGRGAAAPAAVRPQPAGRQEEGVGLAGLPAPVPGLHADHPGGRGRRQPGRHRRVWARRWCWSA